MERRDLRVDDAVTVDQNAVRGKWNIGRVIEVYPGPDGKVRNIKVKTPDGEYNPPITEVAVLHPAECYEDETKGLIGAEDVSVSKQ